MTIHYNASGKERKRLAQTIGSFLGEEVKYAGAPTFAYHIGEFTLDRDANLIADGTLDPKREKLLDCIDEAGFISEIDETLEKLEKTPSIDSITDVDSLTLSFPDMGFTDAGFERLQALALAKAMKITRETAMQLWMQHYGYSAYAEDFDGGLMYRDAYGDPNYYIVRNGERIYCGWNIHHILPIARGGTDSSYNLICTNIITNEMAADKITYWIDDTLYQVKRVAGTPRHEIVRLM